MMDRDSQELKVYSQSHSPSWPPGFFVGSVVFDAGGRSRRRDGLLLVGLAVCAWCLGFAITDWVCNVHTKSIAASETELELLALQRKSSVALAAGASASEPSVETPVLAPKPELVADTHAPEPSELAHVNTARRTPKLSSQTRAIVSGRNTLPVLEPAVLVEEEPSPAVSEDEVRKTLALALASKRIFASLDEAASKPIAVLPPPAATVPTHAAREAKVVAIEDLSVDGGLPSKVVTRGLKRLLPQYDRCREFCDDAPQRLTLSTTIDEAGRGRRVTVEGLSQPGMRRCLEQATSHLVVPAPDTGTAHARWIVRFAAR